MSGVGEAGGIATDRCHQYCTLGGSTATSIKGWWPRSSGSGATPPWCHQEYTGRTRLVLHGAWCTGSSSLVHPSPHCPSPPDTAGDSLVCHSPAYLPPPAHRQTHTEISTTSQHTTQSFKIEFWYFSINLLF